MDEGRHVHSDLITQAHQLRAVLGTYEQARSRLLPPVMVGDWSGAAQLLYSLSLFRVHTDAAGALDQLRIAVACTERALDSLGSRG